MKKLIWFLERGTFLVFIALVFNACKNDTLIGLEVQPKDDQFYLQLEESFDIKATTIPGDSVLTDKTITYHLLGTYVDPVFGKIGGDIYTQLRLEKETYPFDSLEYLEMDSLVLTLKITNSYANLSTGKGHKFQQRFIVRELNETMSTTFPYYSNTVLETKPALAGSALTTPLDSFTTSAGTKEISVVRIPLDKSFALKLMNAGFDPYNSQDNFLEYLKGLHIAVDTTNLQVGEGAVMYIDLDDEASKLTMYVHNTFSNTLKEVNYLINTQCAKVTHIEKNNVGTALNAAFYSTTTGAEKMYVQSMGGAKTKLDISDILKFVVDENVVINKATVKVQITDATDLTTFPPHEQLFLVAYDDDGQEKQIVDFNLDGQDAFGGIFDSEDYSYTFTITRHMQQLMKNHIEGKDKFYGFALVAGGASVNANRTILAGPENASGAIQLKIYYSPY